MKRNVKSCLMVTLCLLVFFACNETSTSTTSGTSELGSTADNTESSATITAIDTSTSSSLTNYTAASFSKNVFLHNAEGKILIGYDFFPTGSDVCQQATYDATTNPNGCRVAKTVVIPCEYQSISDSDLLSVDLNASSTTTSCDNKIVVDMDAAEFTVNGLVFTTTTVEAFEADFEFKVTRDGFIDTLDGTALTFSSDDVSLEEVYEKIVEKRIT